MAENVQKRTKNGRFVRQNLPLRNDFFWFGSFSIILSKIKFFTDQDMIQGIAQNYSKYDKSSQKLPKKGDFLQQISTKRSGLLHIFFESISLACLRGAIWTPKFYQRLCFHVDMSDITSPIFTISAKTQFFSRIKM